MSAATAPVTDDREKRDLFAVYLTVHAMHRLDFEEVLKVPVLRGCLRNTLEAMRRRIAKAKAKAIEAPEAFQLTP